MAGCSGSEPGSPENAAPREPDLWGIGSAESLLCRRRPTSLTECWVSDVNGLPGVVEGDMPRRNSQRKPGTACGSPRRARTAKALRISRYATKSRCACKRGAWGRLSNEGRDNTTRSERGPLGQSGLVPLERRCITERASSTPIEECVLPRSARRAEANCPTRHMGVGRAGPPERPALEPYWGKPAVRNLRGGDGNVGIIRSPVRAIVLPDQRARWPRDGASKSFSIGGAERRVHCGGSIEALEWPGAEIPPGSEERWQARKGLPRNLGDPIVSREEMPGGPPANKGPGSRASGVRPPVRAN